MTLKEITEEDVIELIAMVEEEAIPLYKAFNRLGFNNRQLKKALERSSIHIKNRYLLAIANATKVHRDNLRKRN